jgi:ribosomal protein S18 acetylase RimI-like enzyme
MDCTRATPKDVPGIGKLFLESFSDSVIHTCGKIPNFAAIEELFSCVFEAEPEAVFVARDAADQVVGYVLAPSRISNLWKRALWGGHLFRWAWHWLKGDYGFGWYPVRIMVFNKIEFFRSAFTPQVHAPARILSIAVSPLARGQGLGTKLMKCALQYFQEKKVPIIRLEVRPDNAPAIKVYEKLGFVQAGLTRDSQGDWSIMLKEMER